MDTPLPLEPDPDRPDASGVPAGWRLSESTRTTGRRGLARAREALSRARRLDDADAQARQQVADAA